jgi:hypothetical protein
MTTGNIQLVLFGTDSGLLEGLKRSSATLPYISYEQGYGPQVVAKVGLDAVWATPMIGAELFGATPPFPLHEARVLETPAAQLQRGMPRYGIVGVTTSEDDPKTPEYNLRLVLSALLKAVHDFNSKASDQIRRVGILPEDLDLKRMDHGKAVDIIRQIYEGSCAPA